tara:strand:- start:2595 stop:2969 length:375 start_codon:yes stop_codon:yes gene_type:complete
MLDLNQTICYNKIMNTKLDIFKKIKIQPNSCHIFQGSLDRCGYGIFYYQSTQHRAHRIVYELIYGAIPPNMYVCHTCDNPPCCNPDHLFLGTQQDNMKDRKQKNRTNWKPGINTIRKQQNLPLL